MLKIHSLGDASSETKAANAIAQLATDAIPDLDTSRQVLLEIFPHVQCFGERFQDIDLVVQFADYRGGSGPVAHKGEAAIHSFCAAIEVKEHSEGSVRFEGARCIVKYNDQDHDVTNQSEGQKYSVRNYIKKNNNKNSSPYITNLIWLRRVPTSQLPKSKNNLLGSDICWQDFTDAITRIAPSGKEGVVTCFSARGYFDVVAEIFGKRLEPSKIDRKRLEVITEQVLDRSKQQYANKLGQQMLIFRGRGGTGKTVRLIRTAYQVYDEGGLRVVLLTYNKALVADIRRLLALLGVKDAVAEGSIAIKTIHSFMYEWLVALGVVKKGETDFLSNYEEHKRAALEYIHDGALSRDDIAEARRSHSKGLAWDLVLIDESQDWPASERDLLFALYGHKQLIIADGVDQFVRGVERIDWREGLDSTDSQIVSLTKSLRLKASLCQTVGHFAEAIEYQNWNLQPLPESHGGRVLLVTGNPMAPKFHNRLSATARHDGNKPIDMLFCVPPSWVETIKVDEIAVRRSRIGMQYQEWGWSVWDAVDPALRDEYATSVDQYRIVQYESCRGLEGWVVVNIALDEFFDHKRGRAEFSDHERRDIFFDDEEAALDYAKKWVMIPLTRAIDTLVIHINDENSYVGQAMMTLKARYPESVELYEF